MDKLVITDEKLDFMIWDYLKNRKNLDELFHSHSENKHGYIKEKIFRIKYNYFYLFDRCKKIYEYFKYGDFMSLNKKTYEELLEFLENNFDKKIHPIIIAIWNGDLSLAEKITWDVVFTKK